MKSTNRFLKVRRSPCDRCLSCGTTPTASGNVRHNYIPNWLKLANEGRIFCAAELSHQTNTLPEVWPRAPPAGSPVRRLRTLHDEFGAVTIGGLRWSASIKP
ncbi:hypothetical protein KCP74_08560 [Salmonella enterica subsp. enterica]|nr:hypothetical protein KCP74_08560 [Salmonella enterica subsp. enterica]